MPKAETGNKYSPTNLLPQMFQSEQMIAYLTEEDIAQMQQYFDAIPGSQATYADFFPLAKELILKVYRVKDPSEVSETYLALHGVN